MATFAVSASALDLPVEVIQLLDSSLDDWVLIGAHARDIMVGAVAGLASTTVTHDVDVTLAASSDEEYSRLVSVPTKRGGTRLRHSLAGRDIDVIPFGDLAPANRVDDGATELDVTGLAEAHRHADTIIVDDHLRFSCASLHAQLVLKVIAWGARGASSSKDAPDVALLLHAAATGSFGHATWDDEPALMATDYVHDLAAALRAGRLARAEFSVGTVERACELLGGGGLQRFASDAAVIGSLFIERLAWFRAGLGGEEVVPGGGSGA